MDQALELVNEYVERSDSPHSIFAINPEKNFQALNDPLLYETYKTADLLIPDGIGVVLAARVLHGIRLTRVPGVEFMEDVCRLSGKKGYKVFIYGAKEHVNKNAVERLQELYPGLEIVGRANGYVKEEDMGDLVNKINESGAEILFLALGSPKQEKWFMTYRVQLNNVRVVQGIGGTLDVIAGNVKRAPEFWRKAGLEWLYRLILDPKRIKRQSVYPLFAGMVLIAKIKK